MRKRTIGLGFFFAAGMFATTITSLARASDGQGVYARPTAVAFEPPDPNLALRIRIDGVVTTAISGGCYAPPACGYLYYSCREGEEALCREQWKEIAAAASAGRCASFGSRWTSTMAGLVYANNGRLRSATEAPAAPDQYPASTGLGVVTLDCGGVIGCGESLAIACTAPHGGSGGRVGATTPGTGGTGGGGRQATGGAEAQTAASGGGSAGASATGGAGVPAEATGGATTGPQGSGGNGAPPDAATTGRKSSGGRGCAVALDASAATCLGAGELTLFLAGLLMARKRQAPRSRVAPRG